MITDLTEGARFLWRERVLRSVVASRAAVIFGGVGMTALLVGYVRDELDRGGGSYGFALAVGGLATVLLSVLLARRAAQVRRARWLALAAVSQAIYVVMVVKPGYALLLVLMFVDGVGVTGLALYDDMVVAERTPGSARGRVFGLSGSSTELAEFAGALVFTALGDSIGVATAMAVAGGAAATLGLAALAPGMGALRADDERRRAGADPAG